MLTKSDIERIRQMLNESIRESHNSLKKELKGDIVSFKDEILGEIRGFRDEVAIVSGYKDQIENHEDRILTLEKRP